LYSILLERLEERMRITMLGHATQIIEVDGKRIITDPWLTDPLYFGQLSHPGAFESFRSLPPVDLVLVSHGHQDHFDPKTLLMISPDTPVVIFKAYGKTAKKRGFTDVHPLLPGESFSFGSIRIDAFPGRHPGGIATYMIGGREGKIFFGGDSVYTPKLEAALRNTRPDACLMPVSGGALGPLKFHMTASEAARLVRESGAGLAIPMHYHFSLRIPSLNRYLFRENCLEEFSESMKAIAPHVPVKILGYNESWEK